MQSRAVTFWPPETPTCDGTVFYDDSTSSPQESHLRSRTSTPIPFRNPIFNKNPGKRNFNPRSPHSMPKPEDIRKSYHHGELNLTDLTKNPFDLFIRWWNTALESALLEPNALSLSTVSSNGQPSSRTVLLKGISEHGFEFYTNYESRKAVEMEHNPKVALLFFWKELERQIRIEGLVEKVSRQRSAEYFQSRPLGSQIGAWASPQSTVIADRDVLDEEVSRIEQKFIGQDPLPLPDHWGGYLVKPYFFEFWQGRADRLHDRFSYTRNEEGWRIERLAP